MNLAKCVGTFAESGTKMAEEGEERGERRKQLERGREKKGHKYCM